MPLMRQRGSQSKKSGLHALRARERTVSTCIEKISGLPFLTLSQIFGHVLTKKKQPEVGPLLFIANHLALVIFISLKDYTITSIFYIYKNQSRQS